LAIAAYEHVLADNKADVRQSSDVTLLCVEEAISVVSDVAF